MIAISYRRDDSAAVAGRLYDRLEGEFGKGSVFMDFDSIPYGVDFREHIKQALAKADVLIVVIGPNWFGESERAKNRLNEPDDVIRLEIAEALKRKMPIIPVLINNASMPSSDSLPTEIESLSVRNGLRLDVGIDFRHHVGRLISAIKSLSGAQTEDLSEKKKELLARPPGRRRMIVVATASLVIFAFAFVSYFAFHRDKFAPAAKGPSSSPTTYVEQQNRSITDASQQKNMGSQEAEKAQAASNPAIINTGSNVTINFSGPPDATIKAINARLDELSKRLSQLPQVTETSYQPLPPKALEQFQNELRRLKNLGFEIPKPTTYRAESPSVYKYTIAVSSGLEYAIVVCGNASLGPLRGYVLDESGSIIAANEIQGRQFTLTLTAKWTGSVDFYLEVTDVDGIGEINVAVARHLINAGSPGSSVVPTFERK